MRVEKYEKQIVQKVRYLNRNYDFYGYYNGKKVFNHGRFAVTEDGLEIDIDEATKHEDTLIKPINPSEKGIIKKHLFRGMHKEFHTRTFTLKMEPSRATIIDRYSDTKNNYEIAWEYDEIGEFLLLQKDCNKRNYEGSTFDVYHSNGLNVESIKARTKKDVHLGRIKGNSVFYGIDANNTFFFEYLYPGTKDRICEVKLNRNTSAGFLPKSEVVYRMTKNLEDQTTTLEVMSIIPPRKIKKRVFPGINYNLQDGLLMVEDISYYPRKSNAYILDEKTLEPVKYTYETIERVFEGKKHEGKTLETLAHGYVVSVDGLAQKVIEEKTLEEATRKKDEIVKEMSRGLTKKWEPKHTKKGAILEKKKVVK